MSSKPSYFHTSITGLTVLSIVSYFLIYYLEVYIANMMSAVAYGDVKVKLRLIYSAVHVLLMGQDGIMLIYLQRYQNDPKRLQGFMRWMYTSIVSRMLVVWIFCLLAISWGSLFPSIHSQTLVSWGSWMMFAPWIFLLSFLDRFFLHLKKYYASLLPRHILQPLLYFLFLCSISHPDEHTVLNLYGLSIVIICLYRLIAYYKHALPSGKATYAEHGAWWKQARHYWSSVIILQTSRSLNLYLLNALGHNQNEVGYYSAILTVVLSLYILTKSVESYLKPWVASITSEPERFLIILKQCNRIRLILVFFLWSFVMIFSATIMQQFGEDYTHYAHALRVLMSCYSIYTLGQPNFDILNFSGHSNDASKIMIFKLIFMLILAIIMIPRHGLWGCLYADGLTNVIAVIIASWRCKKHFNIHAWQL